MNIIIVFAALYSTINAASVAAFGFYSTKDILRLALHIFFECFFSLDILVNFVLEYKDEVDYKPVRNIKKIALKYLKSYFIVDFAATVPLRLILSGTVDDKILELCQLLKLLRISKFGSVMDEKNF